VCSTINSLLLQRNLLISDDRFFFCGAGARAWAVAAAGVGAWTVAGAEGGISLNSYQATRSNSRKEIRSALKCRLYHNEIKSVLWVRLFVVAITTLEFLVD